MKDLIAALLALLVSWIAVKRKSLTRAGAIVAFFAASALYFAGGFLSFFALGTFFFSSALVSKIGSYDKKAAGEKILKKHGTRDAVQVLANSLAALGMALAYKINGNDAFLLACCSALAACNADTWASEIGILSKAAPVSIVTFKPVARGLSGGVTLLGMLASLCGSILIAIIYFLFRFDAMGVKSLLLHLLTITAAGFAGAVIDSLMGALLQAKYRSYLTGDLTEKPSEQGKANTLAAGFAFVTNDLVNLLSSAIPALIVALTVT